ncbi:MAG: hypothetical protein RLZZ22_2004 [Pseudomonadota bacterium]|jgi:cytochrome b
MNTIAPTTTASASASQRPAEHRTGGRRVTDAPTRLYHWLLALSFLGAYLSGDGESLRALHVTLGYTMAGLIVFRLLYGLFGPRQVRLSVLRDRLAPGLAWLRGLPANLARGQVDWKPGQNLLMALAITWLLLGVLPLTLSGYAIDHEWGGEWLEELHEFLGNGYLMLVLTHLGLLLGISLLRRRNQALPMLTGRAPGKGPDLVRRNQGWLAVLLLLAVLGYWRWEWREAPNGLLSSQAWQQVLTGGDQDGGEDED